MTAVQMGKITIRKKMRAIVCFGPATPSSGTRAGEYYQVIIDPDMRSPGGDYIRFDSRTEQENEIHGWQRVEALTVCEVLEELETDQKGQAVTMWSVLKE